MKKIKQIVAISGIVILVAIYAISLIASLSSWEYKNEIFKASLFCTIAVPAVIYGIIIVYKRIHKDDKDNMTIKDMKELNARTVKTDKKKD